MQLILTKAKDLHGIVYLKEYRYGEYKITVYRDPDGAVEISSENKTKTITIKARDKNRAAIDLNWPYYSEETVDELIQELKEAKEVAHIINEQRELLSRKEEMQ